MQFSFRVEDQTGANADLVPLILNAAPTAGTILAGYLSGRATTNVVIYIDTAPARVDGTAATSVEIGVINMITLLQQGATQELIDGNNGGATDDIIIRANPDFLRAEVQFDATLDASNQSPTRTDFVSIIEHELIHGFAFNGWRDWNTGALPGDYQGTFDRYIDVGTLSFVGPWTVDTLGAGVPLTQGNLFHYGNPSDINAEIIQTGIMNGVIYRDAYRYAVQLRDIAMMIDSGVPMQVALGTSGDNVLVIGANRAALGGAGADTITGGSGADLIGGGTGDDTLDGGPGSDTLHGGPGTDLASYLSAAAGVTANLANPALNSGGAAGDIYIAIEGLAGSNFNDLLVGDAANNLLRGGGGNDTLSGGAGVDAAAYGGNASQYATLTFNGSTVVASAAEGVDLLDGIEQVSFANLAMSSFPSAYNYIASYGDLINVFGANGQAGLDHFRFYGWSEGRRPTFDGLDYVASHGDLANVIGVNDAGGALHFIQYGFREGRGVTFNGLEYIASYGDLMNVFGVNDDAGAAHFIQYGRFEGRHATFNGLEYIASYGDLMNVFGVNDDAGAAHFIQSGRFEGRHTTFNGLEYIASHGDLMNVYGASDDGGAAHYIAFGRHEGRQTTFDGLKYIATYGDLINAFAVNDDAGASHFIQYGRFEGRGIAFDPAAYLANYGDLQAAFGGNLEAATVHFIQYGFHEGRHW